MTKDQAINPKQEQDAMLEARTIIRGLLYYADGHELRDKAMSELNELRNRANVFISPLIPSSAGAAVPHYMTQAEIGADKSRIGEPDATVSVRDADNKRFAASKTNWNID